MECVDVQEFRTSYVLRFLTKNLRIGGKLLDTHAAVKRLIDAGLAEGTAEAVVEVANSVQGQLATKADINMLESKIEHLETRVLVKMTGINLAIGGLIVAIVKLV